MGLQDGLQLSLALLALFLLALFLLVLFLLLRPASAATLLLDLPAIVSAKQLTERGATLIR